MPDEMMMGEWPMPVEGRTHDPSDWVTVRAADLRLVLANTKLRRTKATDEAWERCYALINEEP